MNQRKNCTKNLTVVEENEKAQRDETVLLPLEMLVQILFVMLFALVVVTCEYVLCESLYLNKILFLLVFLWTHTPFILMFFNMGRLKLLALIGIFIVECLLLILLFMMRNSLFIALKQDRKMLSENMLHRIVNKLNSNESCVILLVGNRIKAEFIRALNEYPGYKEKLKPFLCHSESLRHKMSHLLENRRFRELTGYEKKLLFLIETNEQWFSSQQLYRHFSS